MNRIAEAIAGIACKKRPQPLCALFKPTTINTLILDDKNKKVELFEDVSQTVLEMQTEISEAMKNNHFDSHFQKEALQTFRNMNASNKRTLEDVLTIFRRKYVRLQSRATAKHKMQKLTFDPNTKNLSDYHDDWTDSAKRAFGPLLQQNDRQFSKCKNYPHISNIEKT